MKIEFLDQDGSPLSKDRGPGFGRSILLEAERLNGAAEEGYCSLEVFYRVTFKRDGIEEQLKDRLQDRCGLLCRLVAGADGAIPPTTIWPQLGFDCFAKDLGLAGDESYETCRRAWRGAEIELTTHVIRGGEQHDSSEGVMLWVEAGYRVVVQKRLPGKNVERRSLIVIRPIRDLDDFRVDVFNAGGRKLTPHGGKLLSSFTNGTYVATLLRDEGVGWHYRDHDRISRLLLPTAEWRSVEKNGENGRLAALCRPVVYHSTRGGDLLNGVYENEHDVVFTLRWDALDPDAAKKRSKSFRVFLVKHQWTWKVGDRIRVVRLADHRAFVEAELNTDGLHRIEVVRKGEVPISPGAYDVVIRPISYGESENTDSRRLLDRAVFRIRPGDLVTRGAPALVVRPRRGGNDTIGSDRVNTQQIVGRALRGAPYFKFSDVARNRDDVYGALIPAEIPEECRDDVTTDFAFVTFHMLPHSASKALIEEHLGAGRATPIDPMSYDRRAGGRRRERPAPVTILQAQPQTLVCGRFLIWPNAYPDKFGGYRLGEKFQGKIRRRVEEVARQGNPFEFDVIARLSAGEADYRPLQLDDGRWMVDGFYRSGVQFVWDPSVYVKQSDQPLSFGHFEYSKRNEVIVWDDEAFGNSKKLVEKFATIRGVVYFPREGELSGPAAPFQIRDREAQPNYPLVIVVHGWSDTGLRSYLGYDYLLEHLALNGFVASSIEVPPGFGAIGRANLIHHNILALQKRFGDTLDDSIGLIGHSRGGLAVLSALRLNGEGAFKKGGRTVRHKIKTAIAIAPADRLTARGDRQAWEDATGAYGDPSVLIVYGSMDGQVTGERSGHEDLGEIRSGFSLYDRVAGLEKTMIFVHGANHESFNREDGLGDSVPEDDKPERISAIAHEAIIKGYVHARLATSLGGSAHHWGGLLAGDWVPPIVDGADDGGVDVRRQHRVEAENRVAIFKFSKNRYRSETELGTVVLRAPGASKPPKTDRLFRLDRRSPHEAFGVRLQWNHGGGRLQSPKVVFDIEDGVKPEFLTKWKYLSFRAGRTFDADRHWNEPDADQDLFAGLVFDTPDGLLHTFARVSKFSRLGPPHKREEQTIGSRSLKVKSVLSSVRIPLEVYWEQLPEGARNSILVEVVFDFSASDKGEVLLNDLEFSRGGYR